jgi:hypothetical protein
MDQQADNGRSKRSAHLAQAAKVELILKARGGGR